MNKTGLLQKPEQKRVPFMDRMENADVVVTASTAEAAYYMTGNTGVISYYKTINGSFTIVLHDIGCKELHKRYRDYRSNTPLQDIQDFFSRYHHIEEQRSIVMESKGAVL